MIRFPKRRIIGLIGAPRVGKDCVAQFLQETRGFFPIAFADRIKEEFGISNADFEAAKIAGNIEELRERLWAFSAEKKKENPLYFINLVIDDIKQSFMSSFVITDIRTPDELNAILDSGGRIYWVKKMAEEIIDEIDAERYDHWDNNRCLHGSKLHWRDIYENKKMKGNWSYIENGRHGHESGLIRFFEELENFFFREEIMDLSDSPSDKYKNNNSGRAIIEYLNQFDVRRK